MTTATLQPPSRAEIDPADLGELMRSVNAVTEQLVATHSALQAQVTSLKKELAEANARLRRTEALAVLGEMAAGIAHEIRNPLGSIRLYTQVLSDEVGNREEPRRLCRQIDSAVARLEEVVREVLTFARHSRLCVQPVDVDEVVERSIHAVEALLHDHGVEVVREHSSQAPASVPADAGLLVSALSNILRNAVEAMVEAGAPQRRITVRTGRRRRRRADGTSAWFLAITVEDTGPGVPEAVAARLFNPFYTTRAQGTGLGLSIAHRVVDAHGGHIAAGAAPAGGARFEICIPEDGPPAEESAEVDLHVSAAAEAAVPETLR